jgi:GR25 family glycosyltransferase involved in LPS biosynthesis
MAWNIFVINLNDRVDRWQHSLTQLEKLGWNAHRVQAIESPADSKFFTNPAVASCWLSHKKALSEFLLTESTHALILEDDFEVRVALNETDFQCLMKSDLDFIQIGFLYTTLLERIYIKFENFYDLTVRTYGFFERILWNKGVSEKLLVRERLSLPYDFVFADIRPGAHCYFLNRKAAAYLISVNDPIFLSTDDLYMSLGKMKYVRMARLRKSKVSQTNSQSSINPR